MGYRQLERDFGYSQSELAKVISKSRSHVANTLRLLKLPEKTKRLLAEGAISAGHARALFDDRRTPTLSRNGSSRRAYRCATLKRSRKRRQAVPPAKLRRAEDSDTRALEKSLTDALGLLVTIAHRGETGEVRIRYKSLDQLDDLCRKLKK